MTRVQPLAAQKRSALTLIELITVIAILGIIAALTVALVPALRTHQAPSRTADDLQGWLFQAKIRALRDKSPRGVRLIRDPADATKVRSIQFIEQPGTWTGGAISNPGSGGGGSNSGGGSLTWTVAGADLTGGLGNDTGLWPVQPGDYLYTGNPGTIRGRITAVTATTITVNQPSTGPVAPTTTWYVVRQPRPIPGEEVLNFPDGVAVDLQALSPSIPRSIVTADSVTGNLDILFAPAGQVVGDGGRDGQIVLWVRDTNRDQSNPGDPGEQTLIVVYTRTGHIGSYPVDTTPGNDPHSLRKDNRFRPSGM